MLTNSIKSNKPLPASFESEIKEIALSLSKISDKALLESNKQIIEVKLIQQENSEFKISEN